jgi:hypothetical protein
MRRSPRRSRYCRERPERVRSRPRCGVARGLDHPVNRSLHSALRVPELPRSRWCRPVSNQRSPLRRSTRSLRLRRAVVAPSRRSERVSASGQWGEPSLAAVRRGKFRVAAVVRVASAFWVAGDSGSPAVFRIACVFGVAPRSPGKRSSAHLGMSGQGCFPRDAAQADDALLRIRLTSPASRLTVRLRGFRGPAQLRIDGDRPSCCRARTVMLRASAPMPRSFLSRGGAHRARSARSTFSDRLLRRAGQAPPASSGRCSTKNLISGIGKYAGTERSRPADGRRPQGARALLGCGSCSAKTLPRAERASMRVCERERRLRLLSNLNSARTASRGKGCPRCSRLIIPEVVHEPPGSHFCPFTASGSKLRRELPAGETRPPPCNLIGWRWPVRENRRFRHYAKEFAGSYASSSHTTGGRRRAGNAASSDYRRYTAPRRRREHCPVMLPPSQATKPRGDR